MQEKLLMINAGTSRGDVEVGVRDWRPGRLTEAELSYSSRLRV
jgi:hypothetical protein